VSELDLDASDGLAVDCVVSFDNILTLRRAAFRRRITKLSARRMAEACQVLRDALGC
jgi:mRNA-degrading endonuclease toxin of MazEF toxin-antitoxin module